MTGYGYFWKCDDCPFTAYEDAVEDPGHITMHRDPDDDALCSGRMRRCRWEFADLACIHLPNDCTNGVAK